MKKLSDYTPNPDNPRTITPEQVARLKESIERDPEFLSMRPIIVDDAGIVLCGNQRHGALVAMGREEVPDEWIAVAQGLDEDKRRRLVLIDNSPEGMSGEFDFEVLSKHWNMDELDELGFDIDEIISGLNSAGTKDSDDEEKEEPRKPFGDHRDTIEMSELLNLYDTVMLQFSGGKDSIAMVQYVRSFVPKEKCVLVWARVPLLDWMDAEDYVKECAKRFDLRLVIADGRPDAAADCLTKLAKRGFPGHGMKWCNSDYKVTPSDKVMAGLNNPIVCMGVRAEESERRRKMTSRGVWGKKDFAYPIFDATISDVMRLVKESGVDLHHSYRYFDRFSCKACFLQSKQDWATMRKYYPEEFAAALRLVAEACKCQAYRSAQNTIETLLLSMSGDGCDPDHYTGLLCSRDKTEAKGQ